MSWTTQGYLFGRPETDYGNGDPEPAIDLRNEQVPERISGLSVYYGCSGAEFFRGVFEGHADEAKAALQKVSMLTVYEGKYGGICRLEDHLPHLVFLEHPDGVTWFFDVEEQPDHWKSEVERLLPQKMHHTIAQHAHSRTSE